MIEFTSEPQRAFSPTKLVIALAILLILAGGIFVYVRQQRTIQPKNAASAVVVPGLLRPGNTNFEYYKNRIRVENVKASLGISFNNARTASIEGIILNDGDRKLEAVELHVTLYDAWGKVSKERTAFALRPGKGINSKPMEPLERRAFYIGVEGVEYYWDPKQISYEITGLKYQ
jgi:hypothetical protein